MWCWYSAATTFSRADFYSQINLSEERYTATGPNKRKSSALDLIIFFLCSKTAGKTAGSAACQTNSVWPSYFQYEVK